MSGMANFNLSLVAARRFPVVDEEAGIALGLAVFIRRPGSPTPRNVFSEWFVVDEGKIRTIYTAMYYPDPERAVPNWPPYDGNWPLPASIVPGVPAPRPQCRRWHGGLRPTRRRAGRLSPPRSGGCSIRST